MKENKGILIGVIGGILVTLLVVFLVNSFIGIEKDVEVLTEENNAEIEVKENENKVDVEVVLDITELYGMTREEVREVFKDYEYSEIIKQPKNKEEGIEGVIEVYTNEKYEIYIIYKNGYIFEVMSNFFPGMTYSQLQEYENEIFSMVGLNNEDFNYKINDNEKIYTSNKGNIEEIVYSFWSEKKVPIEEQVVVFFSWKYKNDEVVENDINIEAILDITEFYGKTREEVREIFKYAEHEVVTIELTEEKKDKKIESDIDVFKVNGYQTEINYRDGYVYTGGSTFISGTDYKEFEYKKDDIFKYLGLDKSQFREELSTYKVTYISEESDVKLLIFYFKGMEENSVKETPIYDKMIQVFRWAYEDIR